MGNKGAEAGSDCPRPAAYVEDLVMRFDVWKDESGIFGRGSRGMGTGDGLVIALLIVAGFGAVVFHDLGSRQEVLHTCSLTVLDGNGKQSNNVCQYQLFHATEYGGCLKSQLRRCRQ